jgi:hypothetical protein
LDSGGVGRNFGLRLVEVTFLPCLHVGSTNEVDHRSTIESSVQRRRQLQRVHVVWSESARKFSGGRETEALLTVIARTGLLSTLFGIGSKKSVEIGK